MSEIEINLTLKFNIPDEDLNVNGLLFGLKGANSQIMLAITKVLFMAYGRSEREIERIIGFSASRWTIWRRLGEFSEDQCLFGDMKNIPYIFLMPDGN